MCVCVCVCFIIRFGAESIKRLGDEIKYGELIFIHPGIIKADIVVII